MAFAAPPSFRVSGSSYLPSDRYLGCGPVFGRQKKIVTSDVRGTGCGSNPDIGRGLYVKVSRSAISFGLHGGNASSGSRTQNNVFRGELRPTVEEALAPGEPVGPKPEDSQKRGDISLEKNVDPSNTSSPLHHHNGNGHGDSSDGSGGNREFPPGGGGGSGGDGNDEHSGNNGEEEEEFGPILKFEEVMREIEARGVKLPSDMYGAAKIVGIRKAFLDNYLALQELDWPLGAAIRWIPLLRNRMLADRQFLFKVGTEIVIDSCCATFAEVQKRGKDFWAEFELYAADLLVGVVVNVALVALLAPYARIGQPPTSKGLFSRMARAYGALPSSVFEAERPGCRFSVQQRIGTYFFKGVLYGSVGFVCGLIGQGIANMIMTAKRSVKKSEEDIPVPPLVKSAALWGVFLAISSNTRYQIINGLERMVESSPLAKRVPPVAMAFTVGVRFANNIYGGMQFVDWARWSGCQ